MTLARGFIVGLFALAVVACSDAGTGDGGQGEASPSANVAPAAGDLSTNDGKRLAELKGDAAAGERVFAQCQACHALEPGQNRVGPSLHGIVGRAAGSLPGYSYSQANRAAGYVWSREKLFQYLEAPRRVMPGTKMVFGGIADAQKRADLVEYLASR